MKFSVRALALTSAIVWGAALLLTGIANVIWPPYAVTFLQVVASVYPGYEAVSSVGNVITGTLYALVDGAVFGLVFGLIYNRMVPSERP